MFLIQWLNTTFIKISYVCSRVVLNYHLVFAYYYVVNQLAKFQVFFLFFGFCSCSNHVSFMPSFETTTFISDGNCLFSGFWSCSGTYSL